MNQLHSNIDRTGAGQAAPGTLRCCRHGHQCGWRGRILALAIVLLGGSVSSCSREHAGTPILTAERQQSGTRFRLQAVCAVNEQIVWASGLGSTFVRTTDGGRTWQAGLVASHPDGMQFRDVHAFDARRAFLLSAGPGAQSRIYRTGDAGASWQLQYINPDTSGFLDAFSFWDADHGLVYGDNVGGTLVILRTQDGGASWSRVPAAALPVALEGEGGFAASGTCVMTGPAGQAWIGTGAGTRARVLRTDDMGETWTAVVVPIVSGPAAGIFSLACRKEETLVAMGGDLNAPVRFTRNVAISQDGGRTWRPRHAPTFPGAVYGSTYVPQTHPPILFAVGPNGAAYSPDDGQHWVAVDTTEYWAVDFASPRAGWAVGPAGRITRFSFQQQ